MDRFAAMIILLGVLVVRHGLAEMLSDPVKDSLVSSGRARCCYF